MATKTFNDICVEYAHQLGKGLPLTAPEMCNAVIMYLNSQITEMQGITTALQTAVAEAEESATEATNTANELSGKVDTLQTAVTEAESSATEAINKANDVSETVNALPKVPTPTTSDNGKVIGVQSGAYALVEQSGGDIPDFSSPASVKYVQGTGATIVYGTDNPKELALPIIAGDNVTIAADSSRNHVVINGIPKDSYYAFDFTGHEENYVARFHRQSSVVSLYLNVSIKGDWEIAIENINANIFRYKFREKTGYIALLDDIPDLDNYTGIMHIVQGTAGSGIAVHDTVKASPYTKYGYDKIETYGNSNTLQYTLNIPNKNGTIATLDDISSAPSTDSRYYTRVIYHSLDEDTQYVLFSCITDIDMTANTSYQNVIDLLNSLGATTNDTALPCSGKTVSGGILVGVYTDGTNIIVFDTDNTTEELNMSAEIKFISK